MFEQFCIPLSLQIIVTSCQDFDIFATFKRNIKMRTTLADSLVMSEKKPSLDLATGLRQLENVPIVAYTEYRGDGGK
jgi:hypothetical protein